MINLNLIGLDVDSIDINSNSYIRMGKYGKIDNEKETINMTAIPLPGETKVRYWSIPFDHSYYGNTSIPFSNKVAIWTTGYPYIGMNTHDLKTLVNRIGKQSTQFYSL